MIFDAATRAIRRPADPGEDDGALDAERVHLVEQFGGLTVLQHRVVGLEGVFLHAHEPVGGLVLAHVDIHQQVVRSARAHCGSSVPSVRCGRPNARSPMMLR
jgi:hypothetical protein